MSSGSRFRALAIAEYERLSGNRDTLKIPLVNIPTYFILSGNQDTLKIPLVNIPTKLLVCINTYCALFSSKLSLSFSYILRFILSNFSHYLLKQSLLLFRAISNIIFPYYFLFVVRDLTLIALIRDVKKNYKIILQTSFNLKN